MKVFRQGPLLQVSEDILVTIGRISLKKEDKSEVIIIYGRY